MDNIKTICTHSDKAEFYKKGNSIIYYNPKRFLSYGVSRIIGLTGISITIWNDYERNN